MSDREGSTGNPSQTEYKTRSGRISKPSAKLYPKQRSSHHSQDQTVNLGDQKPPALPTRDEAQQQAETGAIFTPYTGAKPQGSTKKIPHQQTDQSDESSEWDLDDSEEQLILEHENLQIDWGLLTSPHPNGFGFSPQCTTWLAKLNIITWNDFSYMAAKATMTQLMYQLSVPEYKKHKRDMRKFLAFGRFLKIASTVLEADISLTNRHVWLPYFHLEYKHYLVLFPKLEPNAAKKVTNMTLDDIYRADELSAQMSFNIPPREINVPDQHLDRGGVKRDTKTKLH